MITIPELNLFLVTVAGGGVSPTPHNSNGYGCGCGYILLTEEILHHLGCKNHELGGGFNPFEKYLSKWESSPGVK